MLSAIGVITATFVRTGRMQSIDRVPLYVRATTANDLSPDTRVFLKGLDVGRLRSVIPQIDPRTQELTFLIQLDIDVAFDDGTRLLLPESTTVAISRPTPIAPPVIRLLVPGNAIAGQTMLQPGDTINAEKGDPLLDVIADVAQELKGEIFQTIQEIQSMLAAGTEMITEARHQIAATVPMVDSVLLYVANNLATTETLITEISPRVDILQDSVLATMSSVRITIQGFDSLRIEVQDLIAENSASIEEVMRQMARTSMILGHFADQLSRRPARIITGVTPPPEADSVGANP